MESFMHYVVGKKHAHELSEEDLHDLEAFLSLCGHIFYPKMDTGLKRITGYHRMIRKVFRHLTARHNVWYFIHYLPYLRLFRYTFNDVEQKKRNITFLESVWKNVHHFDDIKKLFPFDVVAPQLDYFCCLLIATDEEHLYFDLTSSAYGEQLSHIFEKVCAPHLPWMKDVNFYIDGKVYYLNSKKYPLSKIIRFYNWYNSLNTEEQHIYYLESVYHPIFTPIDIGQIKEISECELF